MFTTNHHKRPYKEKEKKLRFAHFRRANRVAFAADTPDDDSRHGSQAELEANHYAHLCFVAAELDGPLVAEVDGARIRGRLELPPEGELELPFHPKPFADGTLPHPTRGRALLHYTIEGHDCVADCPVRHPDPEGPWRIGVPKRVHRGTDRMTARHPVRHGWSFVPRGGEGPLAMVGHVKVSDVSATGAALVFGDGLDLQPGDHVAGDLVGPKGERFRVIVELRNVHEDHGATIGGVEFQGLGLQNVARLAATIRSIPKGTTEADDDE